MNTAILPTRTRRRKASPFDADPLPPEVTPSQARWLADFAILQAMARDLDARANVVGFHRPDAPASAVLRYLGACVGRAEQLFRWASEDGHELVLTSADTKSGAMDGTWILRRRPKRPAANVIDFASAKAARAGAR